MILSGDCAKHVAASISIKTVDAYWIPFRALLGVSATPWSQG